MGTLFQGVPPQMDMATLVSATVVRLALAALLGGLIGLERELRHKPAGLRTNISICFGSAMFTILSLRLGHEFAGDHTRIAAQIIPGIGFIGAGSILHSRGSVQGLTTAATLFVVASIGMAVGGGLYLPAIFATLVIFVALAALGRLETRFSLKSQLTAYEFATENAEHALAEINQLLADQQKMMHTVQVGRKDDGFYICFSVEGTRKEQQHIFDRLRAAQAVQRVECLGEITERE